MTTDPLRLLFLKERMAWPRASGHDVHTFYMMQALARRGHAVVLATIDDPAPQAIEGCGLEQHVCFATRDEHASLPEISLTKWQEKFRSYWGVEPEAIRWLGGCAAEFGADAVIVSGLRVLPFVGALPPGTRAVWYAADEWVLHHASQVRLSAPGTWGELRQALHKGLYERAYRKRLDRVWAVTERDARAFRRFAGITAVDVLPNGVDAEHFAPGPEPRQEFSCVFWGRLDFGPNVQALEWFLGQVWPTVRARQPQARLDVFGFQPTPQVQALCGVAGVSLTPDIPDLRSDVRQRQVVVLPFVSGGGIKNKLLEAAALGMPILATPRTVEGLSGTPPIALARRPEEFAAELLNLWADEARRCTLGPAAREWVARHHTWDAAAAVAERGLREIVVMKEPTGT